MNRDTAIGLPGRLRKAQKELYTGGSGAIASSGSRIGLRTGRRALKRARVHGGVLVLVSACDVLHELADGQAALERA